MGRWGTMKEREWKRLKSSFIFHYFLMNNTLKYDPDVDDHTSQWILTVV
jgi:hypothetical protein